MNYESLSLFGSDQTHEGYVRAFLARAVDRGVLGPEDQHDLGDLLLQAPARDGSGLDALEYEQFLATNAQLIEICLHHPEVKRPGFVNSVVREALATDPSFEGWELGEINDQDRRGTDRTKTFGQVKERPCDPNDQSFFGGSWVIRNGDETQRVIFTIHARAVRGSTSIEPVDPNAEGLDWITAMVRARGPAHWKLQVEPDSPLGRWIATIAGTEKIGQHRDQIALGVLSEAVQREITPHHVTHLLLGPSRRDCPERSWHTGRFLSRVDGGFHFRWEGYGLDREERLVEARTEVVVSAKIVTKVLLSR